MLILLLTGFPELTPTGQLDFVLPPEALLARVVNLTDGLLGRCRSTGRESLLARDCVLWLLRLSRRTGNGVLEKIRNLRVLWQGPRSLPVNVLFLQDSPDCLVADLDHLVFYKVFS